MEKQIILNRIKTPDGTILTSYHIHDFKIHLDANGKTYGVDGGLEYLRRIGPNDYIELSMYSDEPFEVIRENFGRINRGKNLNQKPVFVLLKDMNDEWLNAVIQWYEDGGVVKGNNPLVDLYFTERNFRKNLATSKN